MMSANQAASSDLDSEDLGRINVDILDASSPAIAQTGTPKAATKQEPNKFKPALQLPPRLQPSALSPRVTPRQASTRGKPKYATVLEEEEETDTDKKPSSTVGQNDDIIAFMSSIHSLKANESEKEKKQEHHRTLYGGYRLDLAKEAKRMAIDIAAEKESSQQQDIWDNVFGMAPPVLTLRSFSTICKRQSRTTLCLLLLGFGVATLDYFANHVISLLLQAKSYLLSLEGNTGYGYLIFVFFTAMVGWLSVAWTHLIDPMAAAWSHISPFYYALRFNSLSGTDKAGSGIPEMKAILSGDVRREPERYLSRRTFFAKAIGLVLALGAGLSVGREGPFVHISNVIAHQLMKKLAYFKTLYESETLRRQVYIAACAVGVSSAFKAPIGGVLFSIEVTSTFYLVSNYYKGFFAAVTGAVVSQLYASLHRAEADSFRTLYPTNFPSSSFNNIELISFALLGLVLGFFGPFYIYFADKARTLQYHILHRFPLLWPLFISIVVASLLFLPGPHMQISFEETINQLLSGSGLPDIWGKSQNGVLQTLAGAIVVRTLATALSVTLPIPAGDFLPNFVTGALWGRLFGEVISLLFPTAGILPGGYAVVGASAMLGSVTHAFSSAVIAMELTGQLRFVLPALVGTVVSMAVAQTISHSVYDQILMRKGLPYLPKLRFDSQHQNMAKDLMIGKLDVLPRTTTYAEIVRFLSTTHLSHIPIVDDKVAMTFIGCVKREDLIGFLFAFYEKYNLSGLREDLTPRLRGAPQPRKPSFRLEDEDAEEDLLEIDLESSDLPIVTPKKRGILGLNVRSSSKKAESGLMKEVQTETIDNINLKAIAKLKLPRLPNARGAPEEVKQEKEFNLGKEVNLLQEKGIKLDRSDFRIDEETPAEQVHVLFEMMRCSKVFVLNYGKLTGVISRRSLYFRLSYMRNMGGA